MLSQHQRQWGVDQWAAFLSNRPLPCMPRSKALLAEQQEALGERLSALEARGLLVRPSLGGVAAYALSASGHGLLAVLDQLEEWARYAPPA